MELTKAAPTSVATVRDEFDRLFDRMLNTGIFGSTPRVLETLWSPSLEFSENEKEYIVRLEAPGIPREDLEINLEGQSLTISGRRDFEKEEKTEEHFWRERAAGRFVRTGLGLKAPAYWVAVSCRIHGPFIGTPLTCGHRRAQRLGAAWSTTAGLEGRHTMRTDSELRIDVISELNWDPSIRDEDIAIAVKEGVVTLAGTIDTYAQRWAAEHAVERVNGVKAIVNDLTVKLPGALERSDAEIAHAAVNALRWHIEVPDERIQVKVTNGWITLEGEVDLYFQKEAAERAVRFLMGVKGVANLITLRATPTPADIKQRIRAGIKRHAELDAEQITVETSGSRVTLRGTVRSVVERRDAERAAWNAPGVQRVDNDIRVSAPVMAM